MDPSAGRGGLLVRWVCPSDAEVWRELFRAYGSFYATTFDDVVLDGVWAWLLDPRHPEVCLVAEVGREVVGFAHARQEPDTFTAGPGWHLDDLYTDPAHRGRGIGTALIDALARHAAGNGGGTVRWITAADNSRAQRVYDRLAVRTSWVTYEREVATDDTGPGSAPATALPLPT